MLLIKYYVMSPDELNTIELEGTSFDDALKRGLESSMAVIQFKEEYPQVSSWYVEEFNQGEIIE